MSDSPTDYLAPGEFVDSDAPAIVAIASQIAGNGGSQIEQACRLFYAVRDGIRYTAYGIDLARPAFRASHVLSQGSSWCVPKSALLAALCRAVGIPCRLGYADVCNHLATKKLLASMGTNVFYYHGYNEIYLHDRWVKATVAFNRSLCEKARSAPLEFDGVHDSIYHPFDLDGQRHMEYLRDYGPQFDVPYDAILAKFREFYPKLRNGAAAAERPTGDFEAEIQAEASGA